MYCRVPIPKRGAPLRVRRSTSIDFEIPIISTAPVHGCTYGYMRNLPVLTGVPTVIREIFLSIVSSRYIREQGLWKLQELQEFSIISTASAHGCAFSLLWEGISCTCHRRSRGVKGT